MLQVTKAEAAKAQLTSAILLWFFGNDPVSVHTLAVAAHDCYVALRGYHRGKESIWKNRLKSQSRRYQDQVRYAEQFFKHGDKDLTGHAYLHMLDTAIRMVDAVISHGHIYDEVPPLFGCFLLRVAYESVGDPSTADLSRAFPEKYRKLIADTPNVSRAEFHKKIFPFLVRNPTAVPAEWK